MHANSLSQRCKPRPRTGPRSTRGIALIEALVAMLIFMLGVLGLIGMQGSLTRTQTESKVRADAAYLASEVVGRMWADINNLAGYKGDSSCSADSCTEWRAKVAKVLPNGGATITVADDTGDVVVTMTWKLPNGDTHRYATRTTVVTKTAS